MYNNFVNRECVSNNFRPVYDVHVDYEHAIEMFSYESVNVLEFIIQGLSPKEIADRKGRSVKTIRFQINELLKITRKQTTDIFSIAGLPFQLLKIGVLELETIEYPKELE